MKLQSRLALSFVAITLSSCGTSSLTPVGGACVYGSECDSGICGDDLCVAPCVADADCEAGSCAGYDYISSSRFCTATCTAFEALGDGWYCASGVPTRCESGGSELACRTCGCPSGQLCDIGSDACEAPRAVGEPCYANEQCASRNCGRVAHDAPICFVAAGQPCDGTNCGECVTHADGSTECIQACDDSATCGAAEERDMLCWGSEGSEDGFYCRSECSEFDPSSCPEGFRCRELRDRDFVYYHRCYPVSVTGGPASYECEGSGVADACGTCDTDPANDCVQDCAGTFGGGATEDMCGTCDTDAANDCVQDCAGAWGGTAMLDPCGTCDSDPDNDGNVDPCGACDTDPTNDCVPTCTFGHRVLGGCWFVSDYGGSCTSKCSVSGGRYSEQTRRVAGSDGTLAACRAIVTDWQPSITTVTGASGHGGIGCTIERAAVFGDPNYGRQHTDVETTASAASPGYARLCACEF